MRVVRCAHGHYFDSNKYSQCPHCKESLPKRPKRGIAGELLLESEESQSPSGTLFQPEAILPTPAPSEERTVGMFSGGGVQPVVGWLVALSGPDRGRDWRLTAGRNLLGRTGENDLSFTDTKISRMEHCSLVYEPKKSVFALVPGAGPVLLEGEPLTQSRTLMADQQIALGDTVLVFVPFCSDRRQW